MSNSIEQWVEVSREAGNWLWDGVRNLPTRVGGLFNAAGLAVLVAGSGHLLYSGTARLLADD